MMTRTTTIQASSKGARALIGATAAAVAVLGGALLWQARPTSETTAPQTATVGAYNEGVAPMGGLAERGAEERAAAEAAAAARATTRGGMAEFSAERAPIAMTAPATTMGGMAELYGEQQAAARITAAQLEHMGGMAELYRDQAATVSAP